MEMMAIGLVLFAIVLFMSCLCLAVGATPAAPGKNAAGADSETEEQKFIVVKFPESYLVPENYTLDLKVTLHRVKDNAGCGKSDLHGRWYKNRYHQLDEYL